MRRIQYAAMSETGLVRANNEDTWFAQTDLGVFGVSDGIGDHPAGQLASKIVAESLPGLLGKKLETQETFDERDAAQAISDSIIELSNVIWNESRDNLATRGMGATVTLLTICEQSARVAHLGDSRVYLFRNANLTQLTRDHNVAELLFAAGEIHPNDRHGHIGSNQLTRYVGMPSECTPEVSDCFELETDDRVLLCTDGLTSMVKDEAISEQLALRESNQRTCELLVDCAMNAGGKDNVTVMVLSFE